MSTIAEIEAAVDRLPRQQQESLLASLVLKLQARIPGNSQNMQRELWLQQLDSMRARGTVLAQSGSPLQEVLDDIRAERCT